MLICAGAEPVTNSCCCCCCCCSVRSFTAQSISVNLPLALRAFGLEVDFGSGHFSIPVVDSSQPEQEVRQQGW